MSLSGRAAVVGVGATEFSKDAGRSELQLAAEAIVAALADAKLTTADVDGLVSYTVDPVEETELTRAVGFDGIVWSSRVPYGGGGSQGTLLHAAAAVASGAAVASWSTGPTSPGRAGGSAARAQRRRPRRCTRGRHRCSGRCATACLPRRPGSACSRRPTCSGTASPTRTSGRAVVQTRAYAATNPAANYFGKPMSLQEHQESRWIFEPCIRRADCCQESDGAVAMVVVAADEPVSDGAPVSVRILGASTSARFDHEIASDFYSPLGESPESVALAVRLFGQSGLRRKDVDVALIYDAFTPVLFTQLEGLGFCKQGEAKDLIGTDGLRIDGPLPVNTNGGLIGEAYIHGLNLALEAVCQVRGEAVNQVKGARVALASASRSGVLLGL